MYGTIARAIALVALWVIFCLTAGCAICERHRDACIVAGSVAGVAAGFIVIEHIHIVGGARTQVNPAPKPTNPICTSLCNTMVEGGGVRMPDDEANFVTMAPNGRIVLSH